MVLAEVIYITLIVACRFRPCRSGVSICALLKTVIISVLRVLDLLETHRDPAWQTNKR